jgi:hypothetical protein
MLYYEEINGAFFEVQTTVGGSILKQCVMEKNLKVEADKTSILADGIDHSIITVSLILYSGEICNEDLTVQISDGVITMPLELVDGIGTFEYSSLDDGEVTIVATGDNHRKAELKLEVMAND